MVSVSKYLKDTEIQPLLYLYLYLRYISKVSSPTLSINDYVVRSQFCFNSQHFAESDDSDEDELAKKARDSFRIRRV